MGNGETDVAEEMEMLVDGEWQERKKKKKTREAITRMCILIILNWTDKYENQKIKSELSKKSLSERYKATANSYDDK